MYGSPSQGRHGQPGQPGQGGGHGQPAPGGGYGQPAQPTPGGTYGQPAQPRPGGGYGQPARDPYGQPAQGGGYGQPPRDPYGQPPAPGFGSGQFSEPPGFGPPPPPPKGGSSFWLTALAVLAAVVVLAACGVGGWFVFADDGNPAANASPTASAGKSKSNSPSASPSPTASPIDISSRSTDPDPLTVKELFGSKTITIEDENDGSSRSYKMVKSQELTDCTKGVTGDLKSAVKRLSCNQVVRAAVNSKDGKYGATAGVFNLKEKGHSKTIDPLINKDKGSFTGLEGPGASSQINKASLVLYWEERGHYMVYIMISRGDGSPIKAQDKNVQTMATDLLISYLATKLAERTGTVN